MCRELLLMREGGSTQAAGVEDFPRPLDEAGEQAAQRIGVWLAREGLIPDHVLCSPAGRTLASAENALKAMARDARDITSDERLYLAPLPALLEALARAPREAHRVMLVGHNPGLASLLDHLAPTTGLVPGEGDRAMPTASLARLAMPRDWVHLAKGCARLVTLVRASDLPEKFPYPSPHSSELRNRPAYYYTQSSVIPYRLTDDGPQMLVILSAKKRHTIVPKGIKEPGLSAQESAAKEAVEEAGVEGVVEDAPLGSYVYRKWGASCSVQVYALRVTRVLPEDQWPESHRGREWVTPEEASARLAQPALASMVTALAERLRAS